MDITIEKATEKYLGQCAQILQETEVGRQYFTSYEHLSKPIREGINQGNIYVALNKSQCVGFIDVLPYGAFDRFPYIHFLMVKKEFRNSGIGTLLLDYIIKKLKTNRLFLVVADFNPNA